MDGQGFLGATRNAPRAKVKGYPEKKLCQLEENPVHTDCFAQIYILFEIGCIIIPNANMVV